jgi:hypothetical protein
VLVTALFSTTLVHAVASDARTLTVVSLPPAFVTMMDAPGHAFAEIYTSGRREIVLISRVSGTLLTVQRGMRGTSAMPWPAGACICGVEYVAGACPPDGAENPCLDLWAALTVGESLQFDPDLPRLDLRPTGVTPGEYGGAVVNQFGQFTYIPDNWPASALPVFDPCGCLDSILPPPSPTTAADVSYVPVTFAPIVTGTNVQVAIEQLEAALHALGGSLSGGFGVLSVSSTAPITVSGAPANPVVGHAPSGLAPGVYDGFTVDAWGHITAYTAPTPLSVAVNGIAPVVATFNPVPSPLGTYDISVNPASYTAPGVVQLVNPADIPSSVPPSAGGHAVTWDGLQQALSNLPDVLIERATIGAGSWSIVASTQVASGSASTVVVASTPGSIDVQLIPPAPGEYQVTATLRGDHATSIYVENLSASLFRIHWVAAGIGTATHVDFHVTDLT